MRKAPQIIILAILVIFGGWAAFWFVGARTTEGLLTAWVDDRRAEGWDAQFETLDTQGFPNRFDTVITGLTLADPDTSVAWSAPELQLLSLSYRPTQVIAVFPREQVFATATGRVAIEAAQFRGSFALLPEASLPVAQAILETETARLTNQAGEETGLDRAQLALRQTPGAAPEVYDIDLAITGLRPASDFLLRASEAGGLSEVVERVHVGATVTFDAPWDRAALEDKRPQPRQITLSDLDIVWGGLALSASGTLDVDGTGRPRGTLDVAAQNWREIIAVARSAGAIEPGFAALLAGAGEILAQLSGDPNRIEAQLRFDGINAFFGPVALGPAPILRLP